MTREDQIHLEAAEGWLQLRLHVEAFEELENVTPENRAHPDVLSLRWEIYTAAKSHVAAEAVAEGLTRVAPKKFDGYWMRSHSLRELGRTQDAYDALAAVRQKFSGEWMLHYHLAIYLCLLGRLDEARISLERTFDLNPDHRIDALEDEDIEQLWTEIQRK
jgi:tetratricopeptide (TPR) repeat protein